ncbi:MAG TPA: AAA family ATPase [Gemmatimonadales bacterium]|nr:AAA family ATPase [Gemmatimonadales bacterium]
MSSVHLASVTGPRGTDDVFPFTVPAIRSLRSLDFPTSVTFFVGENGSGKSTLLEGLAAAARLPAIGSADMPRDDTLAGQRRLGKALRLSWTRRATRGFFLRAEDFFGFTKRLSQERAEFQQRLNEIEVEYREQNRSAHAAGLAMGPARASLAEMERRYGIDLDANSHGQSFLKLFRSRFVPGGLYLLDEPEAPLSPQSQLALLAMIGDMVGQDAQFIIATHSPLLLAFPAARIYSFDTVPVQAVSYEELDHVRLTRDFLNSPERYVRQILKADTPSPDSGEGAKG